MTPTIAPRPWRAPIPARLASLAPFVVAVAVPLLAGPRLSGPMFTAPSSGVLGIPLDVLLTALTLGWAGFGAFIVWTTGSRLATTLAIAFLTLPSMFAVLVGPAILLILQSLDAIR